MSLSAINESVAVVSALAHEASVLSAEVRSQAEAVRRSARTDWRSGAAQAQERAVGDSAARLDRCAQHFADLAADLQQHARAAEHRGQEVVEMARRANEVVRRVLVDGVSLDDYVGGDA